MTPNSPHAGRTVTMLRNPTTTGLARTRSVQPVMTWVAITAVLAYQALSVAAIGENPHWNLLTHQLSEYALGRQGWLQTGAFSASAVAYAALFTALRPHVNTVSGRVGLGMLAYYCHLSNWMAVFVLVKRRILFELSGGTRLPSSDRWRSQPSCG